MARSAFLVYFEQKVYNSKTKTTTTQKTATAMTCIDRVAKALDLDAGERALKFSLVQKRKKAAFKKNVWTKDAEGNWLVSQVDMPETEINYVFSSRARKNKVTLYLRGKGTNKSQRTLTFTAPATLTVAQIGDALADLIPATKRGTGVDDILPVFSINGGRQYPLPSKSEADATPEVNVPDTQAEAQTIISTAEPQKPTK